MRKLNPRFTALATGLLVCASLASACISAEEERRRYVSDVSLSRSDDAMPRDQAIAKNLKLLRGDTWGSAQTTLRWQAAQNLGNLQAWEAWETLWTLSLTPSRDSAAAVRRECIISLGKMAYDQREATGDGEAIRRRASLIATLSAQLRRATRGDALVQTRVTDYEEDHMVLMAMLDALITIGLPDGYQSDHPEDTAGEVGRGDVTIELLEIARTNASQSQVGVFPFPQNVADGLFEGAVAGVFLMLGMTPDEAARARLGWVPRAGDESVSPTPWETGEVPSPGPLPSSRTSLGVSRSRLLVWLRLQARDTTFRDR